MASDESAQGILLSNRLRLARERAGLSQGQVAKLLSWHRPSVSEMEAGRRRVEATELVRLADIYGTDVNWLLGEGSRHDEPLRIVAREIKRLDPDQLDNLMDLISSLRREKEVDEQE